MSIPKLPADGYTSWQLAMRGLKNLSEMQYESLSTTDSHIRARAMLAFKSLVTTCAGYAFAAATLATLILKKSRLVTGALALSTLATACILYRLENNAKKLRKELENAIRNNQKDSAVCELIKKGADIFAPSQSYWQILGFGSQTVTSESLLTLSAKYDRLDVITLLLDIREFNLDEKTLALCEARSGDAADALIKAGADVNGLNKTSHSSVLFSHINRCLLGLGKLFSTNDQVQNLKDECRYQEDAIARLAEESAQLKEDENVDFTNVARFQATLELSNLRRTVPQAFTKTSMTWALESATTANMAEALIDWGANVNGRDESPSPLFSQLQRLTDPETANNDLAEILKLVHVLIPAGAKLKAGEDIPKNLGSWISNHSRMKTVPLLRSRLKNLGYME